jgi:hypothetical protein
MNRNDERSAYCRDRAAECAVAATSTTLADVREAYLNLARAWLYLVPEIESGAASAHEASGLPERPRP